MNRPPIPVSIYDMDKTITRRPTFTPFLLHAARTHASWRLILVPFVFVTIFCFAVGLIGRGRLKEVCHRLLLGYRLAPADADALAQSFADATVGNNLLHGAVAQIAADRAAGHRLVLATASYELYARPIAERLGFDDVVATRSRHDHEGAVLARIDGENCYGEGKLRMVEAWLAASGLARDACHVRFYSDHVSDAPVFDWADEAIPVNVHAQLATLAWERGWRVSDWR